MHVNGLTHSSSELPSKALPKSVPKSLQDTHGRTFHYLRISVTDACNFKCVYCLPNGYKKSGASEAESHLTIGEITNLVTAFSEMGFWKVRITGGEPTVRSDIIEICREVSRIPHIRKVALSTNGYRLRELAPALKDAGVSALNVSLDSLNPDRFEKITGRKLSAEILSGIDRAMEVGFESIKVNAVLMKGLNDQDFGEFLAWVKNYPVSVRFIELMETGQDQELFEKHHVSAGTIQFELLKNGWKPRQRLEGDGPAIEYEHPDYRGKIGLIAPYSKDFCASCNRLRISSRGGIRLCLFGEQDFSLRHLLQSPAQKEELIATVQNLLFKKDSSHHLHERNYGNTWNFAAIGG